MKTLDEVITGMTELILSGKTADVKSTVRDALFYLKEYRKLDSLDAVAFPEDDNPPLSWEQLKQMEGKPVWVEAESLSVGASPYWKDWYIIKSFSDDEFMYCNDGFEWAKETQGRLWQAYRMERG